MGTTLDPPYDPFADDMSALIAAYILEDVGVTAYKARPRMLTFTSSGLARVEPNPAAAMLPLSSAPRVADALAMSKATVSVSYSVAGAADGEGVHLDDQNLRLMSALFTWQSVVTTSVHCEQRAFTLPLMPQYGAWT